MDNNPTCCGQSMSKAGKAWSGYNKVQRYRCQKCGKTTIKKGEGEGKMKNLLVATINHNVEDRRVKIVCRKADDGRYHWYEAETGLETCCPAADTVNQAADNAGMCWGRSEWDLKATWY